MDITNIHPKVTPIYQTSVFKFASLAELEEYYTTPDRGGRFGYSRSENPNTTELVAEVARLEGAASGGVATGSGLGGLLAAVLATCKAGDHVLCPEELYGGSVVLLSHEMTRLGIETSYVPLAELYDLERWIKPNTRLVLAEVLSNPLLTVLDGPRLASACQAHGIKLLIDSSFTTPMLSKPLSWGADMVWHSATKYLGGHSDVMAGVVVAATPSLGRRLHAVGTNIGTTLAPMEAWLTVRGLKTLRLRMRQHSENALAVAQFLAKHPAVAQVYYPGLTSHGGHELAREQLLNGWFGGMLSFRLQDDSAEAADRFIQRTRLFPFAPSLAGVASSVSYPLGTSHRGVPDERRQALGITPGLLRLSVGVEEVEELLEDLGQALVN
ncbi:aminotransferase class I/II-fold pyridoxal phosphate-dependent enzyme [Hymenobacter sp. ASUV-10]|uniref:Aminotransferase class I/II-fold pyridoxal phosphate-dependent enzyme n=1 Tax=Hymenobacter aranciens TaxID=3063996 RepID=A0ABT9B749_9BACT|nr:aminotransferase class I/II-fold pyridoxal phosphate-dependent enzyme [Hymenobacter sp. ASUV-10]MDO7874023.1 aminotransferase class I/II-fold pyridoxal phosphate-dependent enzyme [Hymenobacter sp. ASUV-10]